METNIFDIETKPYNSEEILRQTKPFNKDDVKIGNLKDPEKIQAKLEKAEIEYNKSLLDKASLDPHTSSICAIGINLSGSDEVIHLASENERDILEGFWTMFVESNNKWAFWSGSNTKESFDPRHLIVRSWKLGVRTPYALVSQGGWLTDKFLDISQVYLFGGKYPSYCSADNAVKQLSLIGKESGCGKVISKVDLEKEGVEGKNFYKILESDRELALKYLTNDVCIERAIADRIL
jgi:hypothetical protein